MTTIVEQVQNRPVNRDRKDAMMSISARLLTPLFAVALLMAVGCSSTDRHVFNSTSNRPVTVSVIDVTNNEPIWSMPVPAGQKLILDLDHSSSTDNPFMASGVPADKLTWKTFPLDSKAMVKGHQVGRPLDSGVASLPGTPVVLDVKYQRRAIQEQPAAAEQQAPPAEEEQPVDAEEPAESQEAAEPEAADIPEQESMDEEQTPTIEISEPEPAAGEQAPVEAPEASEADETSEADDTQDDEPIMFK